MTVAEYLEKNGLVTINREYLDYLVWKVEEKTDCYHIYIQPGLYCVAVIDWTN